MDEQTIKYVWLDKDGGEVSPNHSSFRAAIGYINSYSMRKRRIETGLAKARQREDEWAMNRYSEEARNLSKTGKDPVKLSRVLISRALADLTADETLAAAVFLPVD